jgi:3-methylcrotonyl-CoA carboxylase alpha subunit
MGIPGLTALRPIRRLLIANRGEIAIRIARAARAAGIVALGVYSEADAPALHVEAMDDAACIGPGPATESYLDASRVLAAAAELRADAVHPGYGFLSERAPFARAVLDAGLIFVGPPPAAIAAMGDKTEAKRRAREHGVPVVPGYEGDEQDPARLRAEAGRIGTPLLIKASAGGGGRGMRVVADLADFDAALEAAKREAQAAFGDAKVLLERYLVRPRHIEFQILADAHGTTLHLGERECSIQRRHQKVIEEAPSVALDAALRERMGQAAVRAAQSVGYTNAGTVEFLLDERGEFYFLEMNARLQVEHPVTELVHGIDLVDWQLRIASGEPLSLRQSDIAARGWAIEARVNAEDPAHNFLPAIGTIVRYEAPSGDGIRLDSGVRAGSEISIYYDSMLAKLIAFGSDRSAATHRLTSALDAFRIEGLPTNLPLLRAIVRDDAFRAGRTTTAFLEERAPELESALAIPDDALLLAAGAVAADPRAWRIGAVGIPIRLEGEGRRVAVTASRTGPDGRFRFEGDFEKDRVVIERTGGRVVLAADAFRLAGEADVDAAGVDVTFDGRPYRLNFTRPPSLADAGLAAGAGVAGAIVSPMPGKIVKVVVAPGEAVAERGLLVVLEAMKMEHRIEATHDGVVKRVAVVPGQLVTGGAILVELEGTVNAS